MLVSSILNGSDFFTKKEISMIAYPLGEILKEMGVVTDAQLEAALHAQKASHMKVGELLVELNFVTPKELARAVSIQKDIDYVDIESVVPQSDALALIEQEFAQANTLLPLKLEGDTLHVVTADPDEQMLDYLREMTGKQIQFALSDFHSIVKFSRFYYEQPENSIETKIEKIIEHIDDQSDVVDLASLIIDSAFINRATDIHIMPEVVSSHIFYRIDGVLQHFYALPSTLHYPLISHLKILGKLDIAQNIKIQSGEFSVSFLEADHPIRISAVPTSKGEKIALRLQSADFALYALEDLGYTPAMIETIDTYLNKGSGMLLVIGPSGSGKTSTLYAMMRRINILERNVVSIEEPVEFRLPFVSQIEVNPPAGLTYAKGLKHIARQDPNVIVIGEVLDQETAQLAIQSSLSGQLVLTTNFGNNPSSTFSKLKDYHIDFHSLADGLSAIITQRLVRRLCHHCKEAVEMDRERLLREFPAAEEVLRSGKDSFQVYTPKGCTHCKGSGYHGRIVLATLFEVDQRVRDMLLRNADLFDSEHYVSDKHIKNFEEDALFKVLQGHTSIEEVKRVL